MTTPTTPPDSVMPPLPVVAYLRTAKTHGSPIITAWLVERHPEYRNEYEEPLCKVSDAQAYAAQQVAELEAKLAALTEVASRYMRVIDHVIDAADIALIDCDINITADGKTIATIKPVEVRAELEQITATPKKQS